MEGDVVKRLCVICESEFAPRGPQKTCSKECAIKRQSLKNNDWKKKNLSKDYLAEKAREWRGNNPQKYREKDNERSKKNHWKNRNRRLIQKTEYNKVNPESHVRSFLKQQIGFTPPPELVEEATAIRLLRRAIKKAGE